MPSALLFLSVGLTANVILGPLGLGLLQWRLSANLLNQTTGAWAPRAGDCRTGRSARRPL